jgi:hypothetical protein
LLLAANVQDATDSRDNSSTFYSFNVGDQLKLADWQLTVSGALNKNMSAQINNTSVGPVVNLNRPFLEGKIRSAASFALLKSYTNGTLQSENTNVSLTNTLKVIKKHSFGLNMYYLKSNEVGELGREFSEVRGMINYSYSF